MRGACDLCDEKTANLRVWPAVEEDAEVSPLTYTVCSLCEKDLQRCINVQVAVTDKPVQLSLPLKYGS
jgi:hypothetical protein